MEICLCLTFWVIKNRKIDYYSSSFGRPWICVCVCVNLEACDLAGQEKKLRPAYVGFVAYHARIRCKFGASYHSLTSHFSPVRFIWSTQCKTWSRDITHWFGMCCVVCESSHGASPPTSSNPMLRVCVCVCGDTILSANPLIHDKNFLATALKGRLEATCSTNSSGCFTSVPICHPLTFKFRFLEPSARGS